MVRVAFVLGNVTARDEASRHNLISQPSHLDVLLNALQYYVDCDKQVYLIKYNFVCFVYK